MEQQTLGAAAAPRHQPYEDLQALLTGTLLTAFGIVLLQQAGLVSGGTVGLALLLHYATGLELGLALVLVNAPFYLLAWARMGRAFTLKTALAVGLLAVFVWLLPRGLEIGRVAPVYGAVLGGLLTGVGLLVLFRHRASLGGFNVLALHAQRKLGWRAGMVQMVLDAAVVLGAGLAMGPAVLPASVLAVVVLNAVLAINHRPGRYVA
jgi:uncharacterized membrane-anchored protein YitT (DUF2179 family)